MRLIVCLDDRNGMLFHKRRLSSDAAVCRDILAITSGSELRMNGYSAKLFSSQPAQITVSEDVLNTDGDAWCFVENLDIIPVASGITAITIYHWNRSYPSDTKFPTHLFETRWKCMGIREFPGNSHEKITREDYVL